MCALVSAYHKTNKEIATRLLFCLAVGLLSYAAIEVWLNDDPVKLTKRQAWCDMWLCPQEFSGRRIYELNRESSTQAYPNALIQLRRALWLDTASAYSWADLADAEMNSRHVETAKYCFQRALVAGPLNPVILFRAANFDFQVGEREGTLRLLRTVLTNAGSTYYESTFLTYSRLDLPIQQILDQGMPTSRPVAEAFLHYWMEARKLQESQATWDWMRGKGLVNDQLAGEYVSFLIGEMHLEEAASAWQGYKSRESPEYRKTNWVFNGSFDHEPTGSPLDWHIEKSQDIEVVRNPSGGRLNMPALLVTLLGKENIDFRHVSQTIVLEPGQWRLSAWIKTEGITTNEGVGLHLSDVQDPTKLDWNSSRLIGATDWTLIKENFKVGPQTRLIRLELVRPPSRKFENKVQGAVWLGPVQLDAVR